MNLLKRLKRFVATLPLFKNMISEPIPQSAIQGVKPAGRSAFTKQEFKDEIITPVGKPRIIAGNCEFCGIPAETCPHHAA